jgi:hypothetical protein
MNSGDFGRLSFFQDKSLLEDNSRLDLMPSTTAQSSNNQGEVFLPPQEDDKHV